ncbi:MAG: archaeosortase/exosortase family protein, partial [Alphaproteobacteria bacterium]
MIVPVAFLAFAYPLPDNLYIEFSTTLQRLSSDIGAGVLTVAGVPVSRDTVRSPLTRNRTLGTRQAASASAAASR